MASPTHPEPAAASPTHNETVGVPGHEEAHGAFPPFDTKTFSSQLIWLALTFGVLYFLLSKKLLPKMASVIDGRAESIRSDLSAAETLKTETETALKTYEQALATAKADASGFARTQREQLIAETDRERAAVDAQMAAKVADAEKQIAASKATALSAVNDVASQTVGAIVAKMTGLNVNSDEIASAIAAVKAK